jgi:hypothetical protein
MEDKVIEETIEPKNVVTLEELYEKYVAATHNQMAAITDIDHFKSEIKILEERLESVKKGEFYYYDDNSIGDQKLILSELFTWLIFNLLLGTIFFFIHASNNFSFVRSS